MANPYEREVLDVLKRISESLEMIAFAQAKVHKLDNGEMERTRRNLAGEPEKTRTRSFGMVSQDREA